MRWCAATRWAALGFALTGVLAGQSKPSDRAALLQALASPSAREVAWAAHFAREANEKALTRPLLDVLARWRDDATPEGRAVCLHALDALLGIGAPVPGDVAAPLLDDDTCGVAAFVLLARAPEPNEAVLLATFRKDLATCATEAPLPPRAVAIGDLLVAQRTPGFAALVADRVRRDVRIRVRDAGVGSIRTEFTLRMPGPGPADWPQPARYRFVGDSSTDLGSWHPVYLPAPAHGAVVRWEAKGADVLIFGKGHWPSPPRSAELEWLCTLAGERAPLHVREHGFDGPTRFVDVATTARDERRELLRRVRTKLVADGALTEQQARPLDGPVGVDVLDERSDKGVELPHVPPAR